MYHPGAPTLPEALDYLVVEEKLTPWEVRKKIEAVSTQWDQTPKDTTKSMIDFLLLAVCVGAGKM